VDAAGRALRGQLLLSTSRNRFLLTQVERAVNEVVQQQYAAGAVGRFAPLAVELPFGDESGEGLAPLELSTPAGRKVLLSGKIDRVDLCPQTGALAVFDYKLSNPSLVLGEVYHGLALQLLTYLLVLEANGRTLAGTPLTPAAAFYVRLLRKIAEYDHPSRAPAAGSVELAISEKPRGLFDLSIVDAIDETVGESGKSKVVAFQVTRAGEPYKRGCDSADSAAFRGLIRQVRTRLIELCDNLAAGDISIRPYRLGQKTPCPHCDIAPLCRFDPRVDRYLHIEPLARSDVLDRVSQNGGTP
jgi:ATP-dependent helicase/nuclease subunit B